MILNTEVTQPTAEYLQELGRMVVQKAVDLAESRGKGVHQIGITVHLTITVKQ